MTELILDTDYFGRSFAFDEQRGVFYFDHQLPESLLSAIVGEPLASMIECLGDYGPHSTSVIVPAANKGGFLVLCVDETG